MYSVEAKNIDAVVAAYGPSTKMGAIVGGQTSTKAPEIAAFEKHLPKVRWSRSLAVASSFMAAVLCSSLLKCCLH